MSSQSSRPTAPLNASTGLLRWVAVFLSWMLATSAVQAQANAVPDIGFNPDANGTVRTLLVQSDGKLLVGGDFTQVGGQPHTRIARLRVDGRIDTTFIPLVLDNAVLATVQQPDGKLVIGGNFTQAGAAARFRIARLNTDGTVDSSFNPGIGPNDIVYALALQPDGRILLGGNFTSVNGTARFRTARLESNGTVDGTFNPGAGASSVVYALAVQPNGNVLVGGNFTTFGGASRNRVARVNGDGSLDLRFDPGSGASNDVYGLVLQPDGRVLLGGFFSSFNGTTRDGIARVNADGSLDSSFNPGSGANGGVQALAMQPDGRVILGGFFTSFNGTSRTRIARVNADGSLDSGFNPGIGANSTVFALAVQPDGRVLVGGLFTSFNGTLRNRMARVHIDGSLDTGFTPGIGANFPVQTIAVQPDGRVLLGGDFSSFNGASRNGIVRTNADGSLDSNFEPGSGAGSGNGGRVYALALQPDDRVLVGGIFSSFNGTGRNNIARVNADGSLDLSFDPGSGANGDVLALAVQPDGRVLVGGAFTIFNGASRNSIARLNADGSLDPSFNPGSGFDNGARALALQPDGRVLVGGRYTTFDGTPRNRIARLNANGSLDSSFEPGTGANSEVLALVLQPDGRLLVSGSFFSFNGTPRNRVARLNANGSLDPSFDPGSGANMYGISLALQPDGRVLVGGLFTSFDGMSRNRIARLSANGGLDSGFDPGTGANGEVTALALQADGRVLVAGAFTSFNTVPANFIARLTVPDGALQDLRIQGQVAQWLRSGAGPELAQPPRLEMSLTASAGSFTAVGNMQRINGGWQLGVPGLPVNGFAFLRASAPLASGIYSGSGGRVESTARVFWSDLIFGGTFIGGFE